MKMDYIKLGSHFQRNSSIGQDEPQHQPPVTGSGVEGRDVVRGRKTRLPDCVSQTSKGGRAHLKPNSLTRPVWSCHQAPPMGDPR